jgi:Cys-tRNA(Pro)/Cys-tRNA(Cys) deacylase
MSKKTNAMRHLDKLKLTYETLEYDVNDGLIDGLSVAKKLNESPLNVFKTLVLKTSTDYAVAVIPVEASLNLKSLAKTLKEKKVEMIAVKDIQKITGYIRGGCSPIGMKKTFKTLIDNSIESIDKIVFSAGKKGVQIKMNASDFTIAVSGVIADIT